MDTNKKSTDTRLYRARRYLSTLLSLWINPFRYRPLSESAILVLGLVAKLAPLAAFILTIQIAVWLITPNRVPEQIRSVILFEADPLILSATLISIPLIVFMLGGIAQKIGDHLSMRVRRQTAYKLIEKTLSKRILLLGEKGPQIREFFVELRMDYQTIHRGVNSMNNILNSMLTVFVAMVIGLLIAPIFMAVVFSLLALLGSLFIIWRHGETMRLLEKKQLMLQDEVNLQKTTQRNLEQKGKSLSSEEKELLLRQFLANGIGNPNELDDRFKSDTNFISAFGPVIGVMALLAFIAGETEVTEERAAQLFMLVLVLRFCIGNIQSVVIALVGLTRDYARLAGVLHRESTKAISKIDIQITKGAI